MSLAAVLVLACVCAVFAEISQPSLSIDRPHTYRYWPPVGPMNRQTTYVQQKSPLWINNPGSQFHKQISEWENEQTSSESEESSWESQRHRDEDDDSVDYPSPKTWGPPPFYESLKDYEDAVADVKRHFTPEVFYDKHHKNFRYLVLVHAVDYLSKTVAEEGWAPYEQNYTALIRESIDDVVSDPHTVVNQLSCGVFQPISRKLYKLIQTMRNPVLDFACTAHPSACDIFLYTIIKQQHDDELRYAANLLLSLGKSASTFLRSYASSFDVISTKNVYLYLLNANYILRELVGKNAEVRRILHPNGSPQCLQ